MTSEFGLAVHALVFLNQKKETVSSEALAQNICTNPARVRKVLAKLKRAGLIETKGGAEGGYHFSLDAAAVNLQEIGEALGTKFVAANWRSGDSDMECLIASGMADVMDGIYAELNELCLDRLRETTIAGVSCCIFEEKHREKPDRASRADLRIRSEKEGSQ